MVGIDQAHGGLAVDAVVEEPKFLGDLDLARAPADVVAGRVLDAFEVTDLLMGAEVADTLPAVRPLALARARSVPDPVRHAPDETFTAFDALPDTPGADEAFGALAEFLGARPLWWSPARVSVFLTSWLPREAILSDAAIAAMPEVLRAWTRHLGDHEEIHDRIAAEAPQVARADGRRVARRPRQAHRREPDGGAGGRSTGGGRLWCAVTFTLPPARALRGRSTRCTRSSLPRRSSGSCRSWFSSAWPCWSPPDSQGRFAPGCHPQRAQVEADLSVEPASPEPRQRRGAISGMASAHWCPPMTDRPPPPPVESGILINHQIGSKVNVHICRYFGS
ncbi:hypothetical protein ACFSTC_09060 [Nonomuraea ferruginea]